MVPFSKIQSKFYAQKIFNQGNLNFIHVINISACVLKNLWLTPCLMYRKSAEEFGMLRSLNPEFRGQKSITLTHKINKFQ